MNKPMNFLFVFNILRKFRQDPSHGIMSRDFALGSSLIMTYSLFGMWFLVIIYVCMMELYSDSNWVEAHRIGFLGEYCNESDYFAVNKWNDYDWDIQFLIISWFLF